METMEEVDKLLLKDEFIAKLKEIGVTDEECEILYTELKVDFFRRVLGLAVKKLPQEEVVQALGKDEFSDEELPEMFRKIGDLVTAKADQLDMKEIFIEAARQVHTEMGGKLADPVA